MIQPNITKKKVHLELMHHRLGHAAMKTLIAADSNDLYQDTKIEFEPTGPCLDCHVATIRTSNRGKKPVGESTIPGQVWFINLIENLSRIGLTSKTYFPYYMNLVDSCSRYQVFIGMHGMSSLNCISAIEQLATVYRPSRDFTVNDIAEIRVDSGSQLISQELQRWASNCDRPIAIIAAAPAHQEMNGKAFDMALRYAWQIKAILPSPGLIVDTTGDDARHGTPFECYFGKRPSIGRYKVFGCPCVVKVYTHKSINSDAHASTLSSKNLVQRGVRGIFVGFPINQAGYLVWVPTSGHLLASVDVMFDEDFTSPLSFPDRIFHDAQPTRNCNHQPPSTDSITDQTGPPNVYPDNADPSLPWTPFTSLPPDDADDHLDFTDIHTDALPLESQPPSEEENYFEEEENDVLSQTSDVGPIENPDSVPVQFPAPPLTQPIDLDSEAYKPYEPPTTTRRSQRQQFSTRDPNFAYAARLHQQPDISELSLPPL
jgi:hypothetical protein